MTLMELLLGIWAWGLFILILVYLCIVPDPDGKTLIDRLRQGTPTVIGG